MDEIGITDDADLREFSGISRGFASYQGVVQNCVSLIRQAITRPARPSMPVRRPHKRKRAEDASRAEMVWGTGL